jgi:uncharacterized protein (TIGR02145 family)
MTVVVAICTLLVGGSTTLLFAQDSESISPSPEEFQVVTIGTQQWMKENLNVDTFRNGDPIPEARTKAEWQTAYKNATPAWCTYNNDPANGKKYGRLYNWYAVSDPRGLAPVGWHVPSDQEWEELTDYLGGEDSAGHKLKALADWNSNGYGNNNSGFSALPGGERFFSDGSFNHLGDIGFWWSSTRRSKYTAWYRGIHYRYTMMVRDNGGMNAGFSVRCINDTQDCP